MLKTIFEISILVLIALGFVWERKLVDFEDKLFAKISRAVRKSRAESRAKTRALTTQSGKFSMDVSA